MKKLLIAALFAAVLTGFSITASYATQPGCYGTQGSGASTADGMQDYDGVMGAMENHSAALRVRDRAQAREIVHENDNGLGMTCFDHALALTGRLGAIFSDVPPAGPFPAPNTVVFLSPVYDQMYGADKNLMTSINNVITPQLQNHVNEFPDSISKAIGATVANALMGPVMAFISGLQAAIMAVLNPILGLITTVTGLMNTFKTAMRALGLVIGLPLSPTFTVLMTTLNTAFAAIKNFINMAFHALEAAVAAQVNTFLNQLVTSPTTSMSGAGADCQRIQSLWGSQGTSAPAASVIAGSGQNVGANEVLRAMTGTGRQQGTPYLSFADMWQAGGGQAAMGTNMLGELSAGSNGGMIGRAQGDMNAGGILSGPQLGSQFWVKTPPAIAAPPVLASPASIINAM